MDILLTHTTALEAMRLPEFPFFVRQWDERTSEIPWKIPKASEMRELVESDPLLRRLSRPIEILVSSDATAHSCPIFTRRVTNLIHPEDSYLRVGEKVLIVCPELVAIQMCRRASGAEGALLMSELCGCYATHGPGSAETRREPLVKKREIVRMVNLMSGAHGTRRAREAIPLSCEHATSQAESRLAAILQAPPASGGYGLRATPPSEVGLGHLWDEWAQRDGEGGILMLRPLPQFGVSGATVRGVVICCRKDAGSPGEPEDRWVAELGRLGLETIVITEREAADLCCLDELARDVRARLGMIDVIGSGTREKRLELLSELERVNES